jgi:hypothetical protein
MLAWSSILQKRLHVSIAPLDILSSAAVWLRLQALPYTTAVRMTAGTTPGRYGLPRLPSPRSGPVTPHMDSGRRNRQTSDLREGFCEQPAPICVSGILRFLTPTPLLSLSADFPAEAVRDRHLVIQNTEKPSKMRLMT